MSENSGPDMPDFKADVDALVEGAAGLFSNLREIFDKSRDEIARASRLGKTRLDLLQLEKDREHFLRKMGEITIALMDEGAIVHESLDELAEKIRALDVRKAEYDAEVARVAEEQAAAASANDGEAVPAEDAQAPADGVDAAMADVEAATDTKKTAAKKTAAKKSTAKKPAAKKKAATKKPVDKKPKKDL